MNTCRLYHVMQIRFAEIAVKIVDKKSYSATTTKNQHEDYKPDDGRERKKAIIEPHQANPSHKLIPTRVEDKKLLI